MSATKDRTGRRATSLGPHDRFLLDEWGDQLSEAFGETAYLVGSVARADDHYRDVDVRMIGDWQADYDHTQRTRALNLAVTLWGRQVTGLPIDFQFQHREVWATHDGEPRNPLIVPDSHSKR